MNLPSGITIPTQRENGKPLQPELLEADRAYIRARVARQFASRGLRVPGKTALQLCVEIVINQRPRPLPKHHHRPLPIEMQISDAEKQGEQHREQEQTQ